jgi:tripartite-type tricarboxylate transporter receptor subunit TctC
VAAREGREAQGHRRRERPAQRRSARRSDDRGVGRPDYAVESWYGAFAPAKTPPAVVAKLNAAFAKVLENPQIKEKLLAQGAEAAPSTQAELDRMVKEELAKWDLVIKTAKIRPE